MKPVTLQRPRAGAGCVLAALAGLLLALPAAGQGLLERVEGAGGTAWLLGSLHFASSDLYPLGEHVERAFAASDRVMVEVDVLALDPHEVSAAVARHGTWPDGETLRGHLPEALWQRLFRAAREVGVPHRALERQRPWLAAFTLTAAFLERNGLEARHGIDQHFMQRARRAGLPLLELESFDAQMRLLEGVPPEQQVLMLEDTIAQLEAKRSLPVELLDAWRRGDRGRLERLLVGGLAASEDGRALARRLLHARNAPMADRIAAEMARGGTVFVVVGAAHLVGEDSIGAKLTAKGLHVTAH